MRPSAKPSEANRMFPRASKYSTSAFLLPNTMQWYAVENEKPQLIELWDPLGFSARPRPPVQCVRDQL